MQVYSVQSELGEDVLYIFEEEDDAVRYAMMLEDKGYPEMHVIEVEPATMIAMCETHEYDYTIITPNDIVIPPDKKNHDLILKKFVGRIFLSTGNQYSEIDFQGSPTTLIVGANGRKTLCQMHLHLDYLQNHFVK